MSKLITTLDARHLAESYHDAMTMVSNRSTAGISTMDNPRQILETYLHWSKALGVRLHNETWEASAENVVEELNAKRREAWAKALGRA